MRQASRELVLDLARALREQVLPALGVHSGRVAHAAGEGGDVTFAIDREAERFLERYLSEHAPEVAFYSEDRGLVLPSEEAEIFSAGNTGNAERSAATPESVLIIDPIDGTRPAMAGLESCCVSVAEAPFGDGRPAMADVRSGCIVEIKSGALFHARRGEGLEMLDPVGEPLAPALSANDDLGCLFWSSGFRGRPAAPLVTVLGGLIDRSSVGGAFFDLGSATFDLTRVLTGQLDAYVDVGPRMIDEQPSLRRAFEHVGSGAVLNNSPYDLAAAVLCLEEAGAVVTDAYGESLDGRPLLGSGHEYQMSCAAAANARLHSALLEEIELGMRVLLGRGG